MKCSADFRLDPVPLLEEGGETDGGGRRSEVMAMEERAEVQSS